MIEKDLLFLENCSNDGLKLLSDFLVYDNDGKKRISEELSSKKGYIEACCNNDMHKAIPEIVDELQRYGGNTILNTLRGQGVSYREILENVCKQLKVPFNKAAATELIEHYLLQQFLIMSIDKMEEEDVHHLSDKLTKETFKQQVGMLKAGSPIFIKLTTMLIANLAKKYGLKQTAGLVAKFAGGKAFAVLTGPIGWVLAGLWTAFDIAGPAYRVLIPCTITIAYLRSIQGKSDEELDEILR